MSVRPETPGLPTTDPSDGGRAQIQAYASPRRRITARRSVTPPASVVSSLSDVAALVSSRSPVETVLQRIVDEAKVVVHSRKAMLWLFDDGGELERSGPVVRGSRQQYPEPWWQARLEQVGPAVIESGAPRLVHDAGQNASLVCVPIKTRDSAIGLLSAVNTRFRSFSSEEIMLLTVLGAFASTAIMNGRLRGHSEHGLLAAERDRIAKEMHDGLAQSLFSASLSVALAKRRVRSEPDEAGRILGETEALLANSLAELRRYIYDLRSSSIEQLGLVGAISNKVSEMAEPMRLRAHVEVLGERRALPSSAEACLYRVAQESVANAVKHAEAGRVDVTLHYLDDAMELLVEDDGRGFDVEAASSRADLGDTFGLASMRERISAEGGRLRIRTAPQRGTAVWVSLPC